MHQLQQPADFAFRKAFSREPGQVVAGQIGDQRSLVLAKRHCQGHEAFEVFGFHEALAAGPFHDHALLLQRSHDKVAMVSLDFDHAILRRTA